jgi:hypothetical protein
MFAGNNFCSYTIWREKMRLMSRESAPTVADQATKNPRPSALIRG